MINNNIFRLALAISALTHALLIGSGSLPFYVKERSWERDVEITYIFEHEEAVPEPEKSLQQIPEIYDTAKNDIKLAGKHAEKPEDNTPFREREPVLKEKAAGEAEEDYIRYHSLIRERIKKEIGRNYARDMGEGEIELVFTVDSKGKLLSVKADDAVSAENPKLRNVALRSLGAVSPFPPFPHSLEAGSLVLRVLIVFKKR